jgi:hypothetical protein
MAYRSVTIASCLAVIDALRASDMGARAEVTSES